MRMRPTDINIAGAVDLSGLRAPTPPAGSGRAPTGPAGTSAGNVIDVTEATFEVEVLQRSMAVPVLIDFWAEWCDPCKQLSPVLERLAEADNGAWVLAKVDVEANQALASRLQLQGLPTVLLALGGRLVQGFTGALPEPEVRGFLDQVLAAAKQAGLAGPGADAPGEPAPEPVEPELLAAEDALGNEDYAAAAAAYDALLIRRPGDPEAVLGKAWATLLGRTSALDPQAVLAAATAAPDDVAAQTAAADVEVLSESIQEAIDRLVALVRRAAGDDRERARAHLLELFSVLDPDDPRIVTGRRSLANALF